MNTAAAVAVQSNPFPGLRPFREDEEYVFFGRESQVDAMVDNLAATHFLAVVGTSGSGKSSLVNCGLRPALHGGLMARAGTAWRMAQFRPGSDPLGALAHALAQDGVLFRDYQAGGLTLAEIVDTTLRMSKLGLIDIYEQAQLSEDVNLLVVVDQFEELFRYRELGAGRQENVYDVSESATAFVNLLLEAIVQTTYPIYVVLTMRSDFLGDCAQFPGLAEAINAGQYLVPRMTRDERRAAISGPVGVGGAEIAPVLMMRLVNDVGDNPDQLSILQHALNRTWARWQHEGGGKGPLDLAHYEAIGTMAHALDQHAEKAYAELGSTRQQRICEKLFKALTDKATDPRGIRRPTTLGTLCSLADATAAEVTEVIDVFRNPSRSFLMPPAGEVLETETVIDISHESLMRVWQRLNTWVDEEARSAQTYRRLADTAALHAAGKASLLRDPDLQLALDWRETDKPTAAWAKRYHACFTDVIDYLEESRQAEEEQTRRANRTRIFRAAVAVVALGLAILAVFGGLALMSLQLARSRQIAFASETVEQADGVLSLLLAIEAVETAHTPEAIKELYDSLMHSHERLVIRHPQTVRYAAWNAKADRILTYCIDRKARLWSYDHKHVRARLRGTSSELVSGARWDSQAERVLLERLGSKAIRWLDENDKPIEDVEILEVAIPEEPVPHDASWPQESGNLKEAIKGSIVKSLESEIPIQYIRGHLERATHVSLFSPPHPSDPKLILTVSEDNTGRVWTADGNQKAVLRGHSGSVLHGAWHPQGKHVITASKDTTVRVWEIEVLLAPPANASDDPSWKPTFTSRSPDGMSVLLANGEDEVRLYPNFDDQPEANVLLSGHQGKIRDVDWYPDDEQAEPSKILITSRDGTARVWMLPARKKLSSYQGKDLEPSLKLPGIGTPTFTSLSSAGKLVHLAGAQRKLKLYENVEDEPKTFALPRGQSWTPTFASLSPDEKTVLLADDEGHVRLYAVANDLVAYVRLRGHQEEILDVDWYPDGGREEPTKILTSSFDHIAHVWSPPSHEELSSRNGQYLEPRLVLTGHLTSVQTGRWSPNGKLILTRSAGGTACIWDESGHNIALLGGHSDKVQAVSWMDDGRLRVIHRDGSSRIWPGTLERLLEKAKARGSWQVDAEEGPREGAPRVLTDEELRLYVDH